MFNINLKSCLSVESDAISVEHLEPVLANDLVVKFQVDLQMK